VISLDESLNCWASAFSQLFQIIKVFYTYHPDIAENPGGITRNACAFLWVALAVDKKQ
jgi:hypothetical protein